MESDGAPRLDTSHGFIKSIIKNQINRDEYHKFMEEKRQKTEKTLTEAAQQVNNEAGPSGTQKKRRSQPQPATQLYIPPHLRRQGNTDGSSTSKMCNSPKRTTFSTNIVDNMEEEKLREKARARFKERFAEQPSMNFAPSTSQISSSPGPSKPLFLLTLRSETSENVDVAVMSNDNPARLAKELSRKHGYTDEQCRKLRETLDYELEKRLNGDNEN
ncbi:unnamed protein product, partial [Mesorhabditis belari]|uniref:Uncharacterized protein n=1 Tax=Mesorhabditis belari TaxID=2138241 RepID=A0AAF3F0P7_9BILA